MIDLSPSEQAYMAEMRMLTTDAHGRRVLVGLTVDESNFYVLFTRGRSQSSTQIASSEDQDRYLELHGKHETARLQVLNAEIELRTDRVTRN